MPRKSRKETPANNPIVFRVTDDELAIIDDNAEKAGLTRADYLRKRTTGHRVVPKPSFYDKEGIRQLKKVGNNLNQLVKIFHAEKKETGKLEAVLEDVKKSLVVLLESD